MGRQTGQAVLGRFHLSDLRFTRLVQLLEGSTFDDFAYNFTGKGFVFGPYINFLGTGFIGIAAAMNTVRVKREFNAYGKVVAVLRPHLDGSIFGIPWI